MQILRLIATHAHDIYWGWHDDRTSYTVLEKETERPADNSN
jgi:hypothetical protein